MNNELKYYKIDHLNKIKDLKPEKEDELSLELVTSMTQLQEDRIGKEINKFFGKFLPPTKDLFKLNLYLKDKYFSKNENKKTIINNLEINLTQLMNKNFNSIFIMNKKNILLLSSVLFYSFYIIQLKDYKIKNENDFLEKIYQIDFMSNNILSEYLNKEKKELELTLKNNKSSFSCQSSNSDILNGKYKYYKKKETNKLIPNELIIIKNILFTIKTLTLTFDTNDLSEDSIEVYLIILLNKKWLFPNVFDIELNYNNKKVEIDISDFFKNKFEKITKKAEIPSKTTYYTKESNDINWKPSIEVNFENEIENENYNFDDSNFDFYELNDSLRKTAANSPNENENKLNELKFKYKSVKQIIFDNLKVFDLMIIYPYFISSWFKQTKILRINASENYSREIDIYLKNQKVSSLNFSYLKFFSNIDNLAQFHINLNGLNFLSFHTIISMIFRNSYLTVLKLNIFPPQIYFQPSSLYKLCNSLKINLKPIFQKNSFSQYNHKNDIDKLLLDTLLEQFEENMNLLFFVLKNKDKLYELFFNFNLPSLILDNEYYINVILKFFYNLILLVFCSDKNYKFFSFISPTLLLDSRSNEEIDYLLNKVESEKSKNKNNLTDLTLQLRLLKVENLQYLINNNIQNLYLGEFDLDTFNNFCTIFEDKNFIESSQLQKIKLSLQNTILKYSLVKDSVEKFLKVKMKKLKEKTLYTFIEIEEENFLDIINIISYDPIEVNCFEFKKSQKFDNSQILLFNKVDVPYCTYKFQIINKFIQTIIGKYLNPKNNERVYLYVVNSVLKFLYKPKNFKTLYIRFKESN